MDDLTYRTILIVTFVVDSILYALLLRRIKKIENKQNNHHEFLLNVKHDIPLLTQKVIGLESQIIIPEENKLN